ncbi:hypothetical protein RRF57_011540 [Xylaria bambusicola]|uniref:Uncharacterized protein n=1 Tax=Xylaria bambusicola TaxID=326684 RepID=A0AAN7ZE61_9PEZI
MAFGEPSSPAKPSTPTRRTASSHPVLQGQQIPTSLPRATSSGTSLSRQSTHDRLSDILEVGIRRASSMNLHGSSPISSPSMPFDNEPPMLDQVDGPDETTSFGAARNTMNYQATQTTSSLRIRQPPSRSEVNPASQNGDTAAHGAEKKHWLWNSLDGFWSIELENKGSVARDHLAVGMI